MKKLQTKLSLNKQTLSVLTARELDNVRGGFQGGGDPGPGDTGDTGDGGDGYFTSVTCCCSKRNYCDRTLTNPTCSR